MQDAEDLIQEALIKLEIYRKSNTIENEKGFLARTVINLSIDHYRRKSGQTFAPESVENYEIEDFLPQPDEVFASRMRLQRLTAGFRELDPVTAEILRSQRIDGMSVKAIAEKQKLSVSAVEKRLAKGLAFLIEWMKGW